MKPKISVIMPVYNTEKYLEEAILSILNQSFTDFELIIIDDGSSDRSPQIIEQYQNVDKRIKVITNSTNQGIIASLNFGLAAARGEYLARMDADDISDPIRFEKQCNYLDTHPQIGILGCACNVINQQGEFIALSQYPENDIEIRWHALFFSPFCHPGVMLRKSILSNHVYPKIKHAEDYALWSLLLPLTKTYNLPEPYLNYRRFEKNISIINADQQQQNAIGIAKTNINTFMQTSFITDDECQILRSWKNHQYPTENNPNYSLILGKLITIYNRFAKTHQISNEFNTKTKHQIYDILLIIKKGSACTIPFRLNLALQALRLSPKFFIKNILS